MIEADQLTRRYGDFAAVQDVSFAIDSGEIVGLLGHNGAGKTTIMKMLTGYLEPSSGAVRIDGVEVESDPQRVQANIGYLPENLPLYPELSVIDYLSYVAELRGVAPETVVRRVIEATELQEKALDTIATLSRGFKQRLGVAQAILHQPRFVILDEPTNGLDPGQTQHMRNLIRDLAASATVILSTHIMQEVEAICDRVLILSAGRLVLDQRLEDIKASNQLRLRLGGAAGGNAKALLAGVDGVASVTAHGDGWQVGVTGDRDAAAERIASALVNAGVPLLELAPVQRDLESVFRTASEGARDAA